MKNFNEMEQELLRSGKADKVKAIADSPDGQKLMQKQLRMKQNRLKTYCVRKWKMPYPWA